MIKIGSRRNIRYIIHLIIWGYMLVIDKIILGKLFDYNQSSIYTFLMFLGEFSGGIIIYKYQAKYLRKDDTSKNIANKLKFNMKLSFSIEQPKIKCIYFKIYILLFMAAFFDFMEFVSHTFYLGKFKGISDSLDSRLYSFLVISNVLTYIFLLKFPILKHQKLAIIITVICFILTIITEYIFQNINEIFTYGEFTLAIFIILIEYFVSAMMAAIDKYLLEYESLDPFKLIMIEGLFGVVFSSLYFIKENPFPEIVKIYNNNSKLSFSFFIILLFLFYLFSLLKNSFRTMVNKLYSPMVLTISDFILNPIQIIINYFEGDFKSSNGQNIIYFLVNLILNCLTAFSTCVYNEFIILFFCGLEYDTHYKISERSRAEDLEITSFNDKIELNKIINELDDDEEENGIYKIYI